MSDEELELITSAKKETKYTQAIQLIKNVCAGLVIEIPSTSHKQEIDAIVNKIMARPKNLSDNRLEQVRCQNYFDGFSLEIPLRDILVPRVVALGWACTHVDEAGPKDFLLTSPEEVDFFLDSKSMLANTVTCSLSEREAIKKGTVDEVLLLVFARKPTYFEFKDVRRSRTEAWVSSNYGNSEYFCF